MSPKFKLGPPGLHSHQRQLKFSAIPLPYSSSSPSSFPSVPPPPLLFFLCCFFFLFNEILRVLKVDLTQLLLKAKNEQRVHFGQKKENNEGFPSRPTLPSGQTSVKVIKGLCCPDRKPSKNYPIIPDAEKGKPSQVRISVLQETSAPSYYLCPLFL